MLHSASSSERTLMMVSVMTLGAGLQTENDAACGTKVVSASGEQRPVAKQSAVPLQLTPMPRPECGLQWMAIGTLSPSSGMQLFSRTCIQQSAGNLTRPFTSLPRRWPTARQIPHFGQLARPCFKNLQSCRRTCLGLCCFLPTGPCCRDSTDWLLSEACQLLQYLTFSGPRFMWTLAIRHYGIRTRLCLTVPAKARRSWSAVTEVEWAQTR
mmetsp:Transcript_128232/g.235909  ORF Transcript_128232/g.235909 Transcript_128232/m.235909 type:complete len:211 (+) Transcript_128232:3-635(+)